MLPIAEIKPSLVMKLLSAMKVGGRKTAKRVRQRILAVCVYAIAKGQAAAPADAASGVSGSGVRIVSLTPWLRL